MEEEFILSIENYMQPFVELGIRDISTRELEQLLQIFNFYKCLDQKEEDSSACAQISGSSSSKIRIILYLPCNFIPNIIMLLFIMFLVYSSSTFNMIMIGSEFMYKFVRCLALIAGGLGDRCHVSMVLRCHLSANKTYWLGHGRSWK